MHLQTCVPGYGSKILIEALLGCDIFIIVITPNQIHLFNRINYMGTHNERLNRFTNINTAGLTSGEILFYRNIYILCEQSLFSVDALCTENSL